MAGPSSEVSKPPRARRIPRWFSFCILLLAFALALHHVDLRPRVQAVAYESANGDLTYGLRFSVKGAGDMEKWSAELGKISDDSLKQRVLDPEGSVGLTDSWFYIRIDSGEEAHLLLATLWQANLISRAEAEAIVGKGPGRIAESLAPVVHRIPSIATLSAAYAAGAHVGTRVILGKVSVESRATKALVGAASVGGAVIAFSRSSRVQIPRNEQVLMASASAVGGFHVSSWERGPVEPSRVKVLSREALQASPFVASSPWTASFDATSADAPLPVDWLEQAAARLLFRA